MTDTSHPAKTYRIPKWFKAVLALSLAGNLAVVGIVAGAALRDDHPRKGHRPMQPPPAAAAIGGAMFRTLERSERRELRALANGSYETVFDRRLAELNDLLQIIRAEPLDVAALKTQLAAQQEAADAVRAQLQSVWLAKLVHMSAPERQDLAQRVEAYVARMVKRARPDRDRSAKPASE